MKTVTIPVALTAVLVCAGPYSHEQPSAGASVAPAAPTLESLLLRLQNAPAWSPGDVWTVRYQVARYSGEDPAQFALKPSLCRYEVLDVDNSPDFPGVAVRVLKATSDSCADPFIMTYRRSDRVLLLVEEQMGAKRIVVAKNVWNGDSARFQNDGAFRSALICDTPKQPLTIGDRTLVDRALFEGFDVDVFPVDLARILHLTGVVVGSARSSSGQVIEIDRPGGRTNPRGFYQFTAPRPDNQSMLVRMMCPADPTWDRKQETTLEFDGGIWWKRADVQIDGKVVLSGERIDTK